MRANDCKRTSQKKVPSDEKLVSPPKKKLYPQYVRVWVYVCKVSEFRSPLGHPKYVLELILL